MSQSELEYSRQLKEKIELYLLALIFTILGLAIQTAKFGSYAEADALEILGWFSLAAAGILGFLRLEWIPEITRLMVYREELAEELDALRIGRLRAKSSGSSNPAQSEQKKLADYSKLDAHILKLERSVRTKYRLHKVLLICGLLFLLGSRGFDPMSGVLRYLGATIF